MKKIFKAIAYIVIAAGAAACARTVEPGPNEDAKRYLDAWLHVNWPNLKPSGLGIYVFEEESNGKGAEVKEGGFVIADYVITDLEGNITSYTDKETAKQLGQYDTTSYYGPKVVTTIDNTIQAGLADAIIGMRVGDRKKVLIPSWLMTYSKYEKPETYFKTETSYSNTIYDITIRDFADSINNYEIAQIEKYMKANPAVFTKPVNDTTGFYYQTITPGTTTEAFPKDTTIYINYTGKLLNGLVFDTTSEKIAKDNGLYSASRTYEPVKIKWGEKAGDLTMGTDGSDIIYGFALTLWHMHAFEKGVGVFYSPLGYSYSGSGSSIPGYSPLVFEIEVVEKPEE